MGKNLKATIICDHSGDDHAKEWELKPDEMVIPLTEEEVEAHKKDPFYKKSK